MTKTPEQTSTYEPTCNTDAAKELLANAANLYAVQIDMRGAMLQVSQAIHHCKNNRPSSVRLFLDRALIQWTNATRMLEHSYGIAHAIENWTAVKGSSIERQDHRRSTGVLESPAVQKDTDAGPEQCNRERDRQP